ncbi:MAG: hypothetical protein NWE92_04560 [Candidatus Bathyarchaeota archaeon]|nr:hypothetical protein [Candidatus Bathyarchaeota archaeon]
MDMRRAALVTAIILIIVLMVPLEQGVIVKANFIRVHSITIESPMNQEYKTSTIGISVVVITFGTGYHLSNLTYSLDGEPPIPLRLSDHIGPSGYPDGNIGTRTLINLADGYHNLEITAHSGNVASASVMFLVNTTGYHSLELLSPLNTTYSKNNVPLTYTCEDNKYSVYYKLDNSNCTSINCNTTLSDLSMGQHTISIRAINEGRLYSEQITNFTVSPELLLSPLDANYTQNNVPLTYTVNNPKYLVYYKIDNSTFMSSTSNITLSGLAEGNHTITVKATDRYGTTLYAEQTAHFTVDTTMQTLTTVVAITLGILAIGAVLAVTYRRRKRVSK